MRMVRVETPGKIVVKLAPLAGVLALSLTFCSCSAPRTLFANTVVRDGSTMKQSSSTRDNLPREIFKRWVHSHEEDSEEIMVFRPASYKFPRSRGRSGFEIKEDGVFVLYAIAPADGLRPVRGTWKLTEPETLVASFEDERIKSYSIQIMSCSEEVLKIAKKKRDL